MSLVSGLLSLVPALNQLATNGASILGLPSTPILPDFLTDNPLPQGYPWGTRDAINTNPYEQPPFTGVIRSYDFTISRGKIEPDGVEREVILVNNAFPGPTIEANWGDTLQIHVRNNLTDEGTALHWHGFLHKETPWFDGVPAVQQCPIAPGKSLTYTFQADLYGSSWYHAHYSAQYSGGIAGPMVIHGPKNADYDIDLGPVMLSDWYHKDYFDIVKDVMTPNNPPPLSDNNLINGKANFNCSKTTRPCTSNAGISKFKFTRGKIHRLRLINSGSQGTQQFRIDGHRLQIIANDFVPVNPYTVDSVTLGVGQRTDILVIANNNNASAYWMRSDLVCSNTNQPSALAAVFYDDADINSVPQTVSSNFTEQCVNDSLDKTTPYYPFGIQPDPATTKTIDMTLGKNASGFDLWFMNNQTYRGNYDHPVLLLANAGNTSYPDDPQWNVYDFGSNSSMRLIVTSDMPIMHPLHLHGHNFFVLAEGNGEWDGRITNRHNPQRRDTQIIRGSNGDGPGYMILQVDLDNPGVWPFHCHIAWHVSAGLYVNILERPADIKNRRFPQIMAQTCRDWANFSNHEVVSQIDSGL